MITLYPDQQQLVDRCYSRWKSNYKRGIIALPTGGGKTYVFSELIRIFTSNNHPVLTLAHREELIEQAAASIYKVAGVDSGVIKSRKPTQGHLLSQVASVQTLFKYKQKPRAWLIVIDECHRTEARTYKEILRHYPNSFVLGVTGTPVRSDGKGLGEYYQFLECGLPIQELINLGRLAPYELVASNKTKSVLNGDPIYEWLRHSEGRSTIINCSTVAQSQKLVEQFKNKGIYSIYHVDGKTKPKIRQAAIEAFKSGELKILSQCGIAVEGLDAPRCKVILNLVRYKKAIGSWFQILGRALRTYENQSAIFIDLSPNWKTLGLPADPIEWTLEGFKKVNPKNGDSSKNDQKLINDSSGIGARELSHDQLAQLERMTAVMKPEEKILIDSYFSLINPSVLKVQFYQYLSLIGLRGFSYGSWRYLSSRLNQSQDWGWRVWQEIQTKAITEPLKQEIISSCFKGKVQLPKFNL